MTNIIDSFDLSDKIIELLSINHDKFYSIRQIHHELCERYEEFRRHDLRKDWINKLKITFLSIEGEFNNIYRIVKDDKHYLIWSLRSKDEIISQTQKESPKTCEVINNDKYEEELENFMKFSNKTDYLTLIKQMIKDKNLSFMYESNYLDGTNHPIHILIMNDDFETLKILDELTIIDYTMKNSEGKNCLDLARERKNCEMVEMFLIKNFEVKMSGLLKINETLKENQKKNYDQISELNGKVSSLQDQIKELKENNVFYYVILFILFILMLAIIKFL